MRSLNNTDSLTDLAEGEDCLLHLSGWGGREGAADLHAGGGGSQLDIKLVRYI